MSPITAGIFFLSVAVLAASTSAARAQGPALPIPVPAPKEIRQTGEGTWVGGSRVTIVIEPDAHPTVRLAAEALETSLTRRLGLKPRILVGDADVAKGEGGMFCALGVAGEGRMVNRLCERKKIKLSFEGIGPDGYVIHMYADRYDRVLIVAGQNPRAVYYGQDTLGQLFEPWGEWGRRSITATTVRDWPTIPFRFAHAVAYPRAVEDFSWLDRHLAARYNLVDLRHDAMGLRWERLTEEDYPRLKQLVDEAHKRSLLVYATFVVPQDAEMLPKMTPVVERVLDLGCDGLWLSCDDTVGDASKGRELLPIMRSLLDLGAKRGMAGDRIAYTPPSASNIGNYHQLSSEHKVALDALPELADALYFITRPPGAEQHAIGVAAGLPKYGWWHNWPRGWRYSASYQPVADPLAPIIATPAGERGKRGGGGGYSGFVSLRHGWHLPDPDAIRDGDKYVNAVMLWGMSAQSEYIQGTMGHWAWDPAGYDEEASRMAIYRTVFGRQGGEPAKSFDDALMRVKMAFLAQPEADKAYVRRADDEIRNDPVVTAGLKEMKAGLSGVEWVAPEQTLLPPDRLEKTYLAPMRAEVAALEAFLGEKAQD